MDTERTAALGLEPLLTTRELANYLGVNVQAIYDLRCDRRGPAGICVGRALRYRVADVGTYGAITTIGIAAGVYRAQTRFRDDDGRVRKVLATGTSVNDATAELKRRLCGRESAGSTEAGLPPILRSVSWRAAGWRA